MREGCRSWEGALACHPISQAGASHVAGGELGEPCAGWGCGACLCGRGFLLCGITLAGAHLEPMPGSRRRARGHRVRGIPELPAQSLPAQLCSGLRLHSSLAAGCSLSPGYSLSPGSDTESHLQEFNLPYWPGIWWVLSRPLMN